MPKVIDPGISVILPTYNRANLLERSISSVLCQSFENFELIVVNDGSTDGTSDLLCSIQDERLRVIHLEKNVGGAEARNAGVRAASAELIAFQDSDDEWLPGKLTLLLEALEMHPNWDGIFSPNLQIEADSESLLPKESDLPSSGVVSYSRLLWGNLIDTPTSVVRRECFWDVGGFDHEQPRFQDWEFFLRFTKKHTVGLYREPLVRSHVTPGGISSNRSAGVIGKLRILDRNIETICADRNLESYWYSMLGDACFDARNLLSGCKYYFRAVLLKPFSFSLYKSIFRSFRLRYLGSASGS